MLTLAEGVLPVGVEVCVGAFSSAEASVQNGVVCCCGGTVPEGIGTLVWHKEILGSQLVLGSKGQVVALCCP